MSTDKLRSSETAEKWIEENEEFVEKHKEKLYRFGMAVAADQLEQVKQLKEEELEELSRDIAVAKDEAADSQD